MEEGTQVPQRRADTVCGGVGGAGRRRQTGKSSVSQKLGRALGVNPETNPNDAPNPEKTYWTLTEAGQRLLQTTPPPRSPHGRTKSLSPQRRYLSMLTIIPRNNR